MQNRSGYYVNNLSGEGAYRSFVPSPLPIEIEKDEEMSALLLDAHKQLAKLDSAEKYIPNIKLFVSMYVRKEALLSSQIEGTQTTLEDVLNPHIAENADRDVAEVVSYVRATEFAIQRLRELPICLRLLKETHCKLMSNARGETKAPGEFRRIQNWIGGRGSTLQNARYVPPNVLDMQKALNDLESYINAPDHQDVLIQAALIHYQFETIHPFLDGNGRMGRLLITLYLLCRETIHSPALYTSYYLKMNRVEYYDRMNAVRDKGDYEQWVKFFLRAISESAADALKAVDELFDLHESSLRAIDGLGRTHTNSSNLLSVLEAFPIFGIGFLAEKLGVSFVTASNLVDKLQAAGILRQTDRALRGRTFAYKPYLDILSRGTEPY